MQFHKRRPRLGDFDGSDGQGPCVASKVISVVVRTSRSRHDDFRSHPEGRSDRGELLVSSGLEPGADAEVDQLDAGVFGQEDIGRFHVTVGDLVSVQVHQCIVGLLRH